MYLSEDIKKGAAAMESKIRKRVRHPQREDYVKHIEFLVKKVHKKKISKFDMEFISRMPMSDHQIERLMMDYFGVFY